MAVKGEDQHTRLERKAEKSVAELIDRVRRQTFEKAGRVDLPPYARHKVTQIDRSRFQRRWFLLFGPHVYPDEKRAFLPLMLLDSACDHRRLRDKLDEYSRYLVRNYIWEWCAHAVTGPMRQQARDLLLREGESDFGETPLAGAIAFVRYHHRMVHLDTLTDYGELYNRAYQLSNEGYFTNKAPDRTEYFDQFMDEVAETPGQPERASPGPLQEAS